MLQFSQNLLAGFNERNEKAVRLMCEFYYPVIEEKVKKFTGGSPDDIDLVKEIICRFLERRVHYKSIKRLEKYLNKVITGTCEDDKRKKKTRKKNESGIQEHITRLHEQSIENERKRLICEYLIKLAVELLPSKTKLVFLMSHVDQMSIREIAVKLNLSPRTVEYHRNEAYKRLRLEINVKQGGSREMLLPVILFPLLIAYLFIQKLLS
jgi:RNA polymerase sigma factor (sigma-70 family)